MKEILLIKNGELALKGLNRSNFEDALVRVLRKTLSPLGQLDIRKAQSTIFIEPLEEGFDFAACSASPAIPTPPSAKRIWTTFVPAASNG